MKRCQNCGAENASDLNFCGECGAKFTDEPQMVVPLDTVESLETPATERITESFGVMNSEETKVGNRFEIEPSVPTFSAQEPQVSSKKLYWIFGGCLILLLITFVGVAGVLYVNWQSKSIASDPKPKPTPLSLKKRKKHQSQLPKKLQMKKRKKSWKRLPN